MTKRIFALLLAILMIASVFAACEDGKKTSKKDAVKDPLKGTWSAAEDGYEMSFTFNGDGTGSLDVAGTSIDTTYKTQGTTLSVTMTYEGNTDTQDFEYTLDGNTLTLDDGVDAIDFIKQ